MNIIVEKVNNKYYAIVRNFSKSIHRYKVKKSWETNVACDVVVSRDLIENPIDLYNESINLLDFRIELDPIVNSTDYYTIILMTEDNKEYPFYIDINKFYNLRGDSKVYFYQFTDNQITLESSYDKKYDFYLHGNFNDLHKVKLIEVVNTKYILFEVPETNYYISEVYYLVTYLNEKPIAKYYFPFVRKKVEFVTTIEDFGSYLKYTVSPKYNYPFLQELEINDGKRTLTKKTKINLYDSFIKNVSFFVPNAGINNTVDFLIKYKVKENYLGCQLKEERVLVSKSLYNKEECRIIDFKAIYNFDSDSYSLYWKNTFDKPVNYKIILDDYYVFNTQNTNFTIKNIKDKNNNKAKFSLKIECDIHNQFFTLLETQIDNIPLIDSPTDFNPIIDYSDALKEDKKTAMITWTQPTYHYRSKIKVKIDFIQQFLDEYLKPWEKKYILDKEPNIFDTKYTDYSKELEYDFNDNGSYKLKSPNDCSVVYNNNSDFVDIGETNKFEIPIWYAQENSQYEITVQIYDRWNQLRGESKCSFKIQSQAHELTDKDIWFNRQQYMQFGETGTIGTFYKITNPTPIDVKYSYAPKYKTYLGQALYDYSNVDNNKVSLYYYLNSNEIDKDLIVKYRRSYNFYRLSYEVKYGQETIVPLTEVVPLGNTFNVNNFKINKSLLQREGEYVMNIKTFSSTNQESSIREIKFYVFNDKPATPIIEINPKDYYMDQSTNKIVINKKYFSLNITNNETNKKYAGWNYKEAHFYFRKINSGYNDYPDYVIQASKEDGSIIFKNTLAIENYQYECKIIGYDYSGNASDPYIFEFNLKSEMSATPELLFTNDLTKPIQWTIKKSQDSEGYYWRFKYSADGHNYEYTEPIKVNSPYKVNDPNSNQTEIITLDFIKDPVTHQYKEGYYQLVVYEWNLRHQQGLQEDFFESPVVEVNKVSNPSNPINCKAITNKVAVFNPLKFNEYAYTDNLDSLVFETIHNEIVIDDPNTPQVEGQYYKLKLIEPSTKNEFDCTLPTPTKIGMYTFTEIAKKCNIANQVEGVWEIRFITVDRNGNNNAYRGYYTYYVNLVKRNPVITSISLNNSNGSEYFGLSSNSIKANIETNCYQDISNFKEHIEKFDINKFQITYLSTPNNTQYTITNYKDSDGLVQLLDPLTENEKLNHSKDGRYLINIVAIDPLNRKSVFVEKVYHIDTTVDCDVYFLTPETFYSRNVTLVASVPNNGSKIYYKLVKDGEVADKKDYKTWKFVNVTEVNYNGNSFNGIQIPNLIFEEDGRKTIAYVVEELSVNTTDVKYYNFLIDSSIKIAPIFDFSNKAFYSLSDPNIYISWNLSSKNIKQYYIKLDKIEIGPTGSQVVVQSYDVSVKGDGLLVPIGPTENHWIDWGTDTSVSILIEENGFLVNGLYRLSVKSISKYGEIESNDFKFQINTEPMIDISEMISKNTITIESNRLSWRFIPEVLYYEISYDNKSFYKTINNYFIVDVDKLLTDVNGNKCIYMRYKNKFGKLTESSKIILNIITKNLKTPKVKFYTNTNITDDNNVLEWIVEVEDPEVSKYIYYSFDNIKWNVANVKGRTNIISDETHKTPIADGEYNVFVMTTDEHPVNSIYYNKSLLAHSYVNIFANSIEKPILLDLISGQNINEPKHIFISNKVPNVDYYIYVNGKLVQEGYEISSSTLKRFDIEIKAKKRGIDNKIFNLISKQDDYHIWSLTTSSYTIDINDEKIKCNITDDNYIEIFSMPEKKDNQIILYKEKNTNTDYKILRVGDRLSLMKEWEFHLTTINIS